LFDVLFDILYNEPRCLIFLYVYRLPVRYIFEVYTSHVQTGV